MNKWQVSALRSTKDYVDLYGNRAPEFAPGSRQSYSNYGFILLGRIVEQVSGLRYDGYWAEHLHTRWNGFDLKPAGERNSTKPRRQLYGVGRAAEER